MNLKSLVASVMVSLPFVANAGGLVDMSSDNDGVKFGVNAAFTLNNLGAAYNVAGEKTLPSFKIDGVVDIALKRSLHIVTGLTYALKGDRYVDGDYKEKVRLGYLEIPIEGSFRLLTGSDSHVQFDFGPYFGVALHGSYKEQYKGESESESIFGNGSDIRRFDFGFVISAGYYFMDCLYAGMTTELGAIPLNKSNWDKNMKTRTLGFVIGYRF